MSSSQYETDRFIERVDELLRRAEDRLQRAVGLDFHRETFRETAEAFQPESAGLWLLAASGCHRLVTVGDDALTVDEDVLASCPATEARIERLESHPDLRRWLFREPVDDTVSLAMVLVLPAHVTSVEVEEILRTMVRLHADAERRRRIGELNEQLQKQNQLLNMISQLHTAQTIDEVCTVLATDGAPLMGIDRVSVLVPNGPRRLRLAAATGVGDPRDRSNATAVLRRLGETCVEEHKSVPWTESADGPARDDAVDRLVRDCFAQSGSSVLRVAMLGSDPDGVMVLEQFDQEVPATDLVPGLAMQAATALKNVNRLSGGGVWGRLKSAASGRGRIIALSVVVALTILGFIPADFVVSAYGTLEPTEQHQIFAPENGTVALVQVDEASRIDADAVLVSMTNPELEVEREKIQGELDATQSELVAVSASRSSRARTPGGLSGAAQAEILRARIESLTRQLKLVDRQLSDLEVRTPIGGRVFHRNLAQSLSGRPVRKGQFLMQVVDPDSPWELDLRVPDSVVRHVMQARNDGNAPLKVTFILRSAPGKTYQATLGWMSSETETDETGQLSTRARVSLDEKVFSGDQPDLRPGSGVVSRIYCGKRPLGYVWFHEVVDFIQRRVLF